MRLNPAGPEPELCRYRGPAFFQSDLGLHKQFPLWNETTRLEFRAEAFNLFNHTNFGLPDLNVSNITRDASGNAIGGTFGTFRPGSTFPAREIQFGLKLRNRALAQQ